MRRVEEWEIIRKGLLKEATASSDLELNRSDKTQNTGKLTQAAVLVPLFYRQDELRVLLTKRSSRLKHHPGQISFPGGKQEKTDQSLYDTALREAYEEIRLSNRSVEILGKLANHQTITGFDVSPFVAIISGTPRLTPDKNEVEEIFSAPFSFLMNPDNYSVQSRYWRGEKRSYYTIPFGPYYIWGATARILFGFATALVTA